MPYTLVKDNVSHDTIEVCKELLIAAQSGEVLGLVFGAVLKRRRFITNTAGECHRDPTFSRGIVAAIDDELAAMVHQRASDTTI